VRSFYANNMTYIIDSHEDIACSALSFGRDLCIAAHETRKREIGTQIPIWNKGDTTLGWPDYQRGKIALVFATIFCAPAEFSDGAWDVMAYRSPAEAEKMMTDQFDYYHRLTDEHPNKFRLVTNRRELQSVLEPWEKGTPGEHPVGLTILMESAEGLSSPHRLEEFYERGLRQVGPVWAGTRYCAGTQVDRPFDNEARALLEVMASLKIPLDISHMRESAALAALDFYDGPVLASHANALSMIKGSESPRHLSDLVIRRLFERGAVIGVVPFNKFLSAAWDFGSPREMVTIQAVAAQIDYYCQMAGSSLHTGIGSDFDGGFGYPNIPLEMDTIADLQKLDDVLSEMGYTAGDIENIFHRNWKNHLENSIPA
jgi:membrane dipeptidase